MWHIFSRFYCDCCLLFLTMIDNCAFKPFVSKKNIEKTPLLSNILLVKAYFYWNTDAFPFVLWGEIDWCFRSLKFSTLELNEGRLLLGRIKGKVITCSISCFSLSLLSEVSKNRRNYCVLIYRHFYFFAFACFRLGPEMNKTFILFLALVLGSVNCGAVHPKRLPINQSKNVAPAPADITCDSGWYPIRSKQMCIRIQNTHLLVFGLFRIRHQNKIRICLKFLNFRKHIELFQKLVRCWSGLRPIWNSFGFRSWRNSRRRIDRWI